MYYEVSNELYHHGIMGQKWGVRRYQNPDGSLTAAGRERYGNSHEINIGKDSKLYRVSIEKDDPTYDNKKYLSINERDNEKWQNYLGEHYTAQGRKVYNVEYMPVKDLKIAPYTKLGEYYLQSHPITKYVMNMNVDDAKKFMGYDTDGPLEGISLALAAQKYDKDIDSDMRKWLKDQGYQGVQDLHGMNTSKDPVIIFDPDENLRQTKVSEFKGKSKPGKLATVRPSSVDNVNDAKDVIKTDTKIIAKQAAKEMASDIMRWEKEGTSRHENLKGMNKQQLENFFEKKIEDNISKGSNYDPNLWDDDSFNFVMDDVIEEYGMPVDFDYDWKNKKVTSMNIT